MLLFSIDFVAIPFASLIILSCENVVWAFPIREWSRELFPLLDFLDLPNFTIPLILYDSDIDSSRPEAKGLDHDVFGSYAASEAAR